MSEIGFDLNINNGTNYKRTLSDIERILDRLDKQANKAGDIFDKFNESLRQAGLGARVFANGLEKSAEGLQKIYEGIRGITPQFKAFVQALEEGFKNGDLTEVFGKEGQDAAEEFLGELKTTWGIASPSRVMRQYADQLGAGFEQGTRALDLGSEGKRLATSFAQNFGTALVAGVRAATIGVVESISGLIRDAGDRLKQGSADLSAQGKALIQTGLQQVLVGGIAGAVQGQLVTKVADFDAILNQVRVFGDLTQEKLDEVEKGILDFSSRTIFDPSQSVAAFLDLEKAGLDAAQSLKFLNAAGDLAAAQNISLADSTRYTLVAMHTFGLGVDDVTKIVDSFSRSADASVASGADLGEGLANVGPIAKEFGLSLEQTLAVLAQFNSAGISGAEAGTQLKSLLVGITRPTKETTEAFKNLGVSLTDSQGKFKPLNQLINELKEAMDGTKTVTYQVGGATKANNAELAAAQKAYAAASRQILLYNDGLTTGSLNEKTKQKNLEKYAQIQANAQEVIARLTGDQSKAETITKEITRTQAENFRAIQALGGSFGGIGLSVLLSGDENAIQGFVDGLGLLPSAADIAKEQMNTFKGALEGLRGSIDALLIKAIRPLLNNFLKPFIAGLTAVVNAVILIPEPILAAAASLAGLVTAFVTLSGVVNIIQGVMMVLVSGPMAQLGGLLTFIADALVNPLGLITAFGNLVVTFAPLIALLGAGFLAFQSLSRIVQAIQANANGAGDAFKALLATLSSLGDTVGSIIDSGLQIISTIMEKVGNVLFGITDMDFSNVTNFFNTINEYAQKALTFLTGVKDTLAFIADAIKGGTGNADQKKALADQKAAVEQISVLQSKAGTVGKTSSKYLVKQGDSLIKIARDMNTSVDDLIKANGGKRFKLFAGSSINLPVTVEDQQAKDEISRLKTLALNAQDDIESGTSSIIDSFAKIVGTDFFKNIFGDQNLNQVLGQLRDLEKTIRREVDRVSANIRTFVENVVASIREFIDRSVQFVRDVVNAIANSEVGQAVSGFIQRLPGIFNGVVKTVSDIFENIRSAIVKFFSFSWLADLGIQVSLPDLTPVRDALLNALGAVLNPSKLIGAGQKLLSSIGDAISGLFSGIQIDGSKIMSAIQSILPVLAQTIGPAINLLIANVTSTLANTLASVSINSGQIVASVTTFVGDIMNSVGVALRNGIDRLGDFGESVRSFFERLLKALVDGFHYVVDQASALLSSSGISDLITRFVDGLRTFDYVGALRSGIRAFSTAIGNAFRTIFDAVNGLLDRTGIKKFVTTLVQNIGTALLSGLAALQRIDYGKVFSDVFASITTALGTAFALVGDLLSGLGIEGLTDFFANLSAGFSNLPTTITNAVNAIGEAIGQFIALLQRLFGAGVNELVNTALPALGNALGSLFNVFKSLFDGNPDAALDSLANVLGSLGTALTSFPISIAYIVRDVLRELGANDIADALDKTLVPALTDLQTGIGGFFDALKGIDIAELGQLALFAGGLLALSNPITALAAAVGVFTALGIGDALPKVGEAVSAFVDTIAGIMTGDSAKFFEGLEGTFTKLADALEILTSSAKVKLTDLGLGEFFAQFQVLATNPLASGVASAFVSSLSALFTAISSINKSGTKDIGLIFPGLGKGIEIIGTVLSKIGGGLANLTGLTGFFEGLGSLISSSKIGGGAAKVLGEIGKTVSEFFKNIGLAIGESGAAKSALGFLGSLKGVLDKLALLGAVVANFEGLKNGIIGFVQNIQGVKFDALLKVAGAIGVLVAPLSALAALGVDLGVAFLGGALPKLGSALKDLSLAIDKLFSGDIKGGLGDFVTTVKDLLGAIGEGALAALDRLSVILAQIFGLSTDFKPSEVIKQIGVIVGALAGAFDKIFSQLGDQLALAIVTALRGIIPNSQQVIDDLTAKLAAGDQGQKLGEALTQQLAGAKVDLSAIQLTATPDDIAKNLPPDLAVTYGQALSQALASGDMATANVIIPIAASPFFPQASKDALSADVFKQVEAAFLAGDTAKVQVLIPVAAKLGVDLAGLVGYGSLSADAVKQAILTAVQTGDTETYNLLMPVAVQLKIDKDPQIVNSVTEIQANAQEVIRKEIVAQGGITVDAGKLNIAVQNESDLLLGPDVGTLDEGQKQALADQLSKKLNISSAVSKSIVDAFAAGGADAIGKIDFNALFAGEAGNTNLSDANVLSTVGINISQSLVDGLKQGFADKSPEIKAAALQMAEGFKTSANEAFGISSPSQWAIDTAGFIVLGLVEGLLFATPLLIVPIAAITATFEILKIGAMATINQIAVGFLLLPAQIAGPLAATNAQMKVLADSIKIVGMNAGDAEAAIRRMAAAGAAGVPPTQPPSGGPRPPGRANPGPVRAGSWFEYADGKYPETYTDSSGRQYMLPSKNGYVSRVNNSPVSNTSNVGGDTYAPTIQINVGAGANVNEDQIYNVAKKALEDDRRENSAQRRMTNSGVR